MCRPYRGLPACFPRTLPGASTRPTLGMLRLSDLLSHFAGEGVSHCGFHFIYLRAGIEHLPKTCWLSLVGCHFRSCAH